MTPEIHEMSAKQIVEGKISEILKLAPEWEREDAIAFLYNRATRNDREWNYLEFLYDEAKRKRTLKKRMRNV